MPTLMSSLPRTSTWYGQWNPPNTSHTRLNTFQNVERTLKPSGKLLLAAWTGSMEHHRVREVARAFLCPELWTAERYSEAIGATGMRIKSLENLTSQVIRTWEICEERARLAGPIVGLLPKAAREFVEGIGIILDAYRSGDLTYTVLTAEKHA